MEKGKLKVIAAVTGASGAIYAKMLLQRLDGLKDQTGACGVIFSENARAVWKYELGEDPDGVLRPDWAKAYRSDDLFAPMASGSSGYDAMIICPCTMGTIGRIAAGISCDLITRAADVMLKERRKLILVPREAPYNLIHLANMKLLAEAGAIICPASPSFYSKPATIDELLSAIIDRVLVLAGYDVKSFSWGETE
jgi:flavin prenyltransferase